MRRTSNLGSMGLSFPPFTRAVKQLLIANCAIFLLEALAGAFTSYPVRTWLDFHFGLVPVFTILHGWIWQLLTYAFLHEGVLHLLFNMLALWMFGAQLEQDWGYNLFMQFYFFCVIGAALTTIVVSFTGLLGASPEITTVGASGGIYGLLLAFGILHGDSEIMLFPLPFLIKAKYFVIGIIGLALYGALSSAHTLGQSTAYMAHLGGLLFGYIFLKFVPRRGFGYATSERYYGLRNSYYKWKRRRAARKFEVYMRKHEPDDYKHDDYFDQYGNFKDPSDPRGDKKNGDSRSGWVN
jgi:membrane associated rhomboid family serine protease